MTETTKVKHVGTLTLKIMIELPANTNASEATFIISEHNACDLIERALQRIDSDNNKGLCNLCAWGNIEYNGMATEQNKGLLI